MGNEAGDGIKEGKGHEEEEDIPYVQMSSGGYNIICRVQGFVS